MLRKFTFALAVAASIIALTPDSASAWGRFGGFGGFGARFGGSHFGGFGARPFGARPFGGSHFSGFGARPFGGSRVASLGGGPRNRPTAFSRPTMQRPTAFTEGPTARTRPTIQRPTTLAKPRPAQSATTPTIATNKNPSSPPAASGSKDNMPKTTVPNVSPRYSALRQVTRRDPHMARETTGAGTTDGPPKVSANKTTGAGPEFPSHRAPGRRLPAPPRRRRGHP